MKKYKLMYILCHGSIVLSVVFTVLFVIDRINPAMGFIGSDQGDWLLLLFCAFALINGRLTAMQLFRVEGRVRRAEREADRGKEG